MKKKLLTLVLLLAVLVCAVAASGVFAAPKELYEYEVRTDGTVGITGADNSIRDAVIPAELDGRRVTAIASHAFLTWLRSQYRKGWNPSAIGRLPTPGG